MTELIDTNIILRLLTEKGGAHFEEAKKIFKEAEIGKRKLLIKPVVVAETCYVLETFYKETREKVAMGMEVFLAQKWLKVEDKQTLLMMWPWYRKNMHFVDSYLLACAKINKFKILTFDKKLSSLSKNS